MSTSEDFSTATDQRPKKFYVVRMFTYIAVSVLYALVNFHKLCPTQVSEDMAKAYGVTKQRLEMFSAIYFYPYAITQPFAGLFADLFDPARVLAVFGTIAASGSLLCGFSKTLPIGIAGRVLVGLGCGPTYVSSLRIMTYWFKKQYLPVLLGILVAISCLGGILAATPLALFSAKFGWRTAFFSIGGTGAILSVLIGIFARGKPQSLGYDPVNEPVNEGDVELSFKERAKELFANIKNVVIYPYFWVIVVFNVTFSCPYLNASAYWNGPFLTDVFNYNAVEIGNILIAHSVGLFVGSLVIPWISKFLKTKKWVMFFGGLFNTSIMALLYMMGNRFTKVALASVLFFFAFWSLTLTNIDYPLLTEYFGPTVSGSAVGFANFFLFIFVAIYQQISAAIIPLNGSQPTPSGVPKYEWAGYRNGLWLFGLVSCAVAIIFALVSKDENSECICRCKKEEKSMGPNLIDE